MKTVCETLGGVRSNIAVPATGSLSKARERPPLPDDDLIAQLRAVIAEMSTYGYQRVYAVLRRKAPERGRSWPNAKRVYRVMKKHGLLLQRYTGTAFISSLWDRRNECSHTCFDSLNSRFERRSD